MFLNGQQSISNGQLNEAFLIINKVFLMVSLPS